MSRQKTSIKIISQKIIVAPYILMKIHKQVMLLEKEMRSLQLR